MLSRQISWAFKAVFRSKTRSFAAVMVTAVTIFLVAATLLLGISGANFGKTARQRFTLPVYLDPNADEVIAKNLSIKIKELPQVKDVQVLTPDELLKNEALQLNISYNEIIQSVGYNPLPYSLVVTPHNPEDIDFLAKEVLKYKSVEDVEYESDVIRKFSNLFELFKWIALGLAALSILVSSIVISATVSLSIASRKEEIEIMNLVGASPATVMGPFIIEGIFYGLLGGGLAAVGIFYGWQFMQKVFATNLPWFNLSIDNFTYCVILFGTISFGFLTGLVTSWFSSRSNLRRIQA